MPFGMLGGMPSNHVLDGGSGSPMVRGNFGGFPPHWKALGLRAPECSATCITEPRTTHNFYDVFPIKDVPREREDKIIIHLGDQKSPKVPFWGRE